LLDVLDCIDRIHERGEIAGDGAIIRFLWGWFHRHVETSDRDFAEYLRSRP
jgi:hypothetical protein